MTFDAVHPGWADTPGLRASLPGFARVIGPLLRDPAQGADTTVWLAAGGDGGGGRRGVAGARPGDRDTTGALWHDRRRRGEYYLPWTRPRRAQRLAEGGRLWAYCAERTGLVPGPITA